MGCRKAWVHHSGGVPRIFIFMENTLSVFIDESGDFGKYEVHSPYYLFAMVIHNQNESISGIIESMDYRLSAITDRRLVHCGPLIRKEEIYQFVELEERRKIFNSLYFFTLKAPVTVKTIIVDKKDCDPDDELALSTKLVKQLAGFIKDNYVFFFFFRSN